MQRVSSEVAIAGMQIQANMKKLRLGFLVVVAPLILAACGGDGSCDANFYSFKNCLNSSSSSSSSSVPVVYYPVGGKVSGLGDGKSVKLSLLTNHAAVAFPNSGLAAPANIPGPSTIGWSFTLDASKTLTHLGLYGKDIDFNADTIVGVWNSSGTFVKSATFDTGFTGVDLDDLGSSGFLWLPVSNLTLSAGNYTIGAFSSADHFGVYTGSVIPAVAAEFHILKSSLYGDNGSPIRPAIDFSGTYPRGFFGPNLRFLTGDQQITVSADGTFTFPTTIADGDHYLLTVTTQPTGQVCVVVNGSGTVSGAGITTIKVNCN